MQLESVSLLKNYGAAGFKGTCQFKGRSGTISLFVDGVLADRILALLAEELVKTSKTFANDLTVDCAKALTEGEKT